MSDISFELTPLDLVLICMVAAPLPVFFLGVVARAVCGSGAAARFDDAAALVSLLLIVTSCST